MGIYQPQCAPAWFHPGTVPCHGVFMSAQKPKEVLKAGWFRLVLERCSFARSGPVLELFMILILIPFQYMLWVSLERLL